MVAESQAIARCQWQRSICSEHYEFINTISAALLGVSHYRLCVRISLIAYATHFGGCVDFHIRVMMCHTSAFGGPECATLCISSAGMD
jgi:hypothetical protein